MSLRRVYLIFTTISLVLAKFKYSYEEYALIKSYPYLVTILQSERAKCLGALLSPGYVVTTADCVYNDEDLMILAGADHENRTSVDRIIKFPTTKWPYDRDAAILILKTDIPTVDTIKLGRKPLPVGTKVKTIGLDEDNGKILISNLEITDGNKCHTTYKLPKKMRENTICAANIECKSNLERSPHGSLLVNEGKLYGLLSVGSFCPTVQYPAIFTDLLPLEQQITNIVES